MKWKNVVHEINELGFEITERDIRYEGNKMTRYNVMVKEKQFEDCYVLYLLSGTIEMLDDDSSYISFRELDRINKICNILTDYYENDIEKNKGDVAETREETKDKIKNIFDSAEQCYGDLFVEISNEDFKYLYEIFEEEKDGIPKERCLSIFEEEEFKYCCFDNSQGEGWVESFDDIDKAIRWFEGESIDDIEMADLEEDDEELCQ